MKNTGYPELKGLRINFTFIKLYVSDCYMHPDFIPLHISASPF